MLLAWPTQLSETAICSPSPSARAGSESARKRSAAASTTTLSPASRSAACGAFSRPRSSGSSANENERRAAMPTYEDLQEEKRRWVRGMVETYGADPADLE